MLDFLVIGAQKSGTTTLYEYLVRHPEIYVPKGKEAPYFNKERLQSYSEFIEEFYPARTNGLVRGKVSPQYMSNDWVASQVISANPDAKYIAILRDPVERAVSHFNMNTNRGLEKRNIEAVISEQLDTQNLMFARQQSGVMESERDCYVVWGEYNRILSYYANRVDAQSMKIIYLEEFTRNPAAGIKDVFCFLNIDMDFNARDMDDAYFSAGKTKFFHDAVNIAKKIGLKAVWQLLPQNLRSQLFFTIEQRVAKMRPAEKILLSSELRGRLESHYKSNGCLGDVVIGSESWCI